MHRNARLFCFCFWLIPLSSLQTGLETECFKWTVLEESHFAAQMSFSLLYSLKPNSTLQCLLLPPSLTLCSSVALTVTSVGDITALQNVINIMLLPRTSQTRFYIIGRNTDNSLKQWVSIYVRIVYLCHYSNQNATYILQHTHTHILLREVTVQKK